MPDLEVIITNIDSARAGLNASRNAAETWRAGAVAGVAHSNAQTTALSAAITVGLNTAKTSITATETELAG